MSELLPETASPPTHYRLEIFRTSKRWITANDRRTWRAKAAQTRAWRDIAAWRSVRELSGVQFARAHVVCELRFNSKRRRDPANWAPTAKAVVDGLVDGGLFADDDDEHLVGPDMRVGPQQDVECLIVHIWPLPPKETHP